MATIRVRCWVFWVPDSMSEAENCRCEALFAFTHTFTVAATFMPLCGVRLGRWWWKKVRPAAELIFEIHRRFLSTTLVF